MIKKIIVGLTVLTTLAIMVVPLFVGATAPPLTGITISPTPIVVTVGENATATVRASPFNAVLGAVEVHSLNPDIATVTGGVTITVTGIREGAATLRVEAGPLGNRVVRTVSVIVEPEPVDPIVFIGGIVSLVRNLLLAIAVLMMLFGAFMFATAAGDDKKVEKGRKSITMAIIAVVVAVIAHGIVIWAAAWAA